MKIKLYKKPKKEDYYRKNCRLGSENEKDFCETYGWETEFIGTLSKLSDEFGEDVYNFELDEIVRYEKTDRVIILNDDVAKENMQMRLALIYDYGFEKEDFEVLSNEDIRNLMKMRHAEAAE